MIKYITLILLLFASPCHAFWQVAGGGVAVVKAQATDNFHWSNGTEFTSNGWTSPKTADAVYANAWTYSWFAKSQSNRTGIAFKSTPTFAADHKSCAVINVVGAGGGVATRVQNSNVDTSYFVSYSGGFYIVYKIVNGSQGSIITTSVSPAISDTVCLSASGTSTTTLTLNVNGTDYTGTDSSSPITTGYPGFRMIGTAPIAEYSSWSGEDL
jgi:hypothetical protein